MNKIVRVLLLVGTMHICVFNSFAQLTYPSASDTFAVVDTFNPSELTILEYFVKAAPEYQTFMKALHASEVYATINNPGPFTIFVPFNAAFTDLPYGNIDELLEPDRIDSLQAIITHHIIPGNYSQEMLAQKIKEKGGEFPIQTIGEAGALTFYLEGHTVFVKSNKGISMPLSNPVFCKNGIIYPLNVILLP